MGFKAPGTVEKRKKKAHILKFSLELNADIPLRRILMDLQETVSAHTVLLHTFM